MVSKLAIAVLAVVLASFPVASGRSQDIAKQRPRHRVLIYYANETPEQALSSPNYKDLLAALRQSPTDVAKIIAKSLTDDGHHFPLVVRRDIQDLDRVALLSKSDLVVFTNTLTLKHKYNVLYGSQGRLETRSFPTIPSSADRVFANSPLSRPEQFRTALDLVGNLFGKDSIDAVLIANSHGTPQMALMPRVNVDLSRTTPEQLLAQLMRSGSGEIQPVWAVPRGTDKVQFWKIISRASALYKMRFSLVFLEACESGPYTFSDVLSVPASVALVAHSGRANIDPSAINYAPLEREQPSLWPNQLPLLLRAYHIHVDSRLKLWLWPTLIKLRAIPPSVCFLPLALWLICFASVTLGRMRKLSKLQALTPGRVMAQEASK